MILFLTLIYIGLLVVLIKLKIVPSNTFTKISPVIFSLLLLVGIFIPMQFGAPSGPAIAIKHAVQVVPNVSGLGGWLADWLSGSQIDVVIDLLSLKYREAVEGYDGFGGEVLPIFFPRKGFGTQHDRRGHLEAVLESINSAK
jgi:hypothetical protein